MRRKLPRAVEAKSRKALSGEPLVAKAIVSEAPAGEVIGALVVTPTRLAYVSERDERSWPLSDVGVADPLRVVVEQPITLGLLAGGELLRFLVPSGVAVADVGHLVDELDRQMSSETAVRIAKMPWWEVMALWPYSARGRVAGGTVGATVGQRGSLGLGIRGVSFYPAPPEPVNARQAKEPKEPKPVDPVLQLPWADVTAVYVESRDELVDRLTLPRVQELDLLSWGVDTSEGETFVSVLMRQEEFYFAAEAPVSRLRRHWDSVLERFADDVIEEVEEASHPGDADLVSRLERLTALYSSGALTEEEFMAAKAAIMRGSAED